MILGSWESECQAGFHAKASPAQVVRSPKVQANGRVVHPNPSADDPYCTQSRLTCALYPEAEVARRIGLESGVFNFGFRDYS